MILHILMKDLKRTKSINVILFLFIILATTFLAASTNNLLTITGAVDTFLIKANAPDMMLFTRAGGDEKNICDYLDSSSFVTDYEQYESLSVMNENIKVTQCSMEPARSEFCFKNMLSIGAVPEHFMLTFDSYGAPLKLKSGEIAISLVMAKSNNLTVGDKISLTYDGYEKDFTLAALVQDAVFGTDMIGYQRLFICGEDYKELYSSISDQVVINYLFNIAYTDSDAFQSDFRSNDFQIVVSLEKKR